MWLDGPPRDCPTLGVVFESVTVRSRELWSVYIRGLTHATRNVRTQVKSTVRGVRARAEILTTPLIKGVKLRVPAL